MATLFLELATFYLGLATLFLGLATFFLENHFFQNGYILVPHQIVVKFQNILECDENFAFLKNEISFNFLSVDVRWR